MGILNRKGVPLTLIDWHRLALGTELRYATFAAQGKIKEPGSKKTGSREPILTNRLAPFYSAIWYPFPRHLHREAVSARNGWKRILDRCSPKKPTA